MTVTSIVSPIATNGHDKAAKAAATKAANVAAKAAKAAKANALLSTAIPDMIAPVTLPPVVPTVEPAKVTTHVGVPALVAPFVPDVKLTADQAIAIAYDYGASMAGQDGIYTKALKQFKDNESVLADMTKALNLGYLVRKMGIDKTEAERIHGLKKHNPNGPQDDQHRTPEQQRVMDSVRVMIHRANKLAGIGGTKTPAQVTSELNRAKADKEKAETESRLIAADAVIHPTKDTDVNTAMVRYVAAMRNYHNGHANLFVGESGSAWREWLQAAPIPR